FRARVADGSHILHGVAKRDGLERGGRRLDAHGRPKALVSERPVDGAQAVWSLGMAGRRDVIEAGGVGDEKRGHQAIRHNGGYIYSGRIRPQPTPGRHHWCLSPPLCPQARSRVELERAAHSHRPPVTLTPAGGAASSGTKKVGASGSPASTRYFSKSVMPSAARKVSSIRKLPVKLRDGFWNTRDAPSATICGVRDIRITRPPPSRFLLAAVPLGVP